ncbi:MAG: FtsX-like permease family protein [Rhodospirillaceae bacterium]|nr:FtsX-like permease family protein [Rhodospirillaceae bacterium]
MKFLPLIWAGLWRKPVRTSFTMLSLVFAFMLFGLLRSIDAGFDNIVANAQGNRIFVQARFFPQALPVSYAAQIRKMDGVTDVSYQTFVGGYYRDPKTFAFVGGASANIFEGYSDVDVKPEALAALHAKPNGVLISPWMAIHLGGLKLGDHYSVHSTDTKQKDGNQDWDFEVVGFLDRKETPGVFPLAFGNYDYINEARAEPRNVVQQIAVHVADADKALQAARAIDDTFTNSGVATRSGVDRANFESALASLGDVKLIINGIVTAVLGVLLLLTATTLVQSADERLNEFAVMKTLGFDDRGVLAIIVAESLLQCELAAAAGLAAAAIISPRMQGKLPGPPIFFNVPGFVFVYGAVTAVVVALIAAAIPAMRVNRLQIVDALIKR